VNKGELALQTGTVHSSLVGAAVIQDAGNICHLKLGFESATSTQTVT
jgi:hypothetical protein